MWYREKKIRDFPNPFFFTVPSWRVRLNAHTVRTVPSKTSLTKKTMNNTFKKKH
jgi:hypothetical protein